MLNQKLLDNDEMKAVEDIDELEDAFNQNLLTNVRREKSTAVRINKLVRQESLKH